MPTEMLTKSEHRVTPTLPPSPVATEDDELREAARHGKRVRRFKINAAVWGLGTILLTTLWVVNEWQANGAFESFGHDGDQGQWNPTLWALAVGVWGLIVGIMGLGVYFWRPAQRLTFHVAAWVLGMVVLTPLWALIEWQDTGGFERWSSNSQPGSWEPWILYAGGIWALVIAMWAVLAHFGWPTTRAEVDRTLKRLRTHG